MKRFLLTGVSLLTVPVTTLAQTAPATAPGGAPAPVSADQNSAGQQGVQDIVVTANRRSENVQKSALAVQAIGSAQIARAGISKLEDLSKIATGVNISTGGTQPQIYIRGVGNYATNANAEGAIAVNLDGVYISRGWATRGAFFDLERIEALKGPQGTLYGRNASGGALNLITVKPVLGETSGYVQLSGGNYRSIGAEAAFNLPITDTVAIRVAGQTVSHDGYLHDGYDNQESQSIRAHLLYKPSSDVSVLLTGFYQHDGGNGTGQTLKNGRNIEGAPAFDIWGGPTQPLIRYYELQNNPAGSPIASPVPGFLFQAPTKNGFNDGSVYGVSGEINWNFGPATLTVLPAYRYGRHSDLFNIAEYYVTEFETDKQTSVEARLSNKSSKLTWVLGGYFFNEDQGNQPGHDLRVSEANFTGDIVHDFSGNTRSYAAFGQATYSLTDRLRVTGGLRYNYERKVVTGDQTFYSGPDQTTGQCTGNYSFDPSSPLPFAPCSQGVSDDGRIRSNSLTYKAGVEYDLAPQSLVYFTVSTGFKSGGIYSAPAPNTFKPEKLMAYEVGSKNRFFDNKLQLNLEGFYYDYKNHQENYLGPTSAAGIFTFVTANAGRAKSYGGLIDLQFQPTHNDQFAASVQYDKSKYDTYFYTSPVFFPPNTTCAVTAGVDASGSYGVNCAGKPIVRTPEWSGNVSYRHSFDLSNGAELAASTSVQFSSKYYTSIEFLDSEIQRHYALLDADLTYTTPNKKLSLSLFGRNLTNHAVFSSSFHSPFVINNATGPEGLVVGVLRPPRTYGARLRLNF